MVIPTPGPFLVRASRLLYENMAYRWWISWTIFASLLQCNSRRERRPLTTTPRFPSSVPSFRLANGSRDTNLAFTLFSSSTSESDGQLSRPQPVLRCGILCSPVFSLYSFPSISPPVSLLRYGMVGTVAGDGAPRSLHVSSPFFGSQLDSPFFVLWQFPCWAPSLLAAVVSPCPRSLRGFCGSWLSCAVLAGLLPHLTIYDHCFTFVDYLAT